MRDGSSATSLVSLRRAVREKHLDWLFTCSDTVSKEQDASNLRRRVLHDKITEVVEVVVMNN